MKSLFAVVLLFAAVPAFGQVTVTVSPSAVTIRAGGQQSFTATVGGSANQSVNWSVIGTGCGTISLAGLYRAPPAVPSGSCNVRAIPQADTTKNALASVVVTPAVSVSISPSPASVQVGSQQQFTATVQNTANTAVYWMVIGTGCGLITTSGLYTAPATIPGGTCTVRAVSKADTTKNASSVVTVAQPSISVSISPKIVSSNACATTQFTATVTGTANTAVTWSVQEGEPGGTVSGSGLYQASGPATTSVFHVVATSAADPNRSDTAEITVTADRVLSVRVEPATVTLNVGESFQFTAYVTTVCRGEVAAGTQTMMKLEGPGGQTYMVKVPPK